MVSINTLHPAPADFARLRIGSVRFPAPAYAKFLKGVKIVIDPGHGGDAQKRAFKRGPTGVREAEMNLRIAQYLREFLVAAGAEVKLTRESDVDLTLEERANVANEWGADLFLSLHHNAIDNKPEANHTTVWYHDSVDYRPSSLDLARYLCQGLYDSLQLPQLSDAPLKSDKLMYNTGFGVLRACRVTSCLTESAFYTNPDEEQRLRDPDYSLREAHGLFLGFARYAAAGLPRAKLVEPADGVLRAAGGSTPTIWTPSALTFELDDGLRGRKSWGSERRMILRDSVAARMDGEAVPCILEDDGKRYTLTVVVAPAPPDRLADGEHRIELYFQNMNKNAVLNPRFVIRAVAPADSQPATTQPAAAE